MSVTLKRVRLAGVVCWWGLMVRPERVRPAGAADWCRLRVVGCFEEHSGLVLGGQGGIVVASNRGV